MDDRHRAQRIDGRFHDEREIRQLGAGAFVLRFLRVADLRHAPEIHFEDRMHVRRRPPARDHVLGDPPAHDRHGNRLRVLAFFERGPLDSRTLHVGRSLTYSPFPALPPDVREDVVLRHTARDAGAAQLRDVDVVLPRDLPDERR